MPLTSGLFELSECKRDSKIVPDNRNYRNSDYLKTDAITLVLTDPKAACKTASSASIEGLLWGQKKRKKHHSSEATSLYRKGYK